MYRPSEGQMPAVRDSLLSQLHFALDRNQFSQVKELGVNNGSQVWELLTCGKRPSWKHKIIS